MNAVNKNKKFAFIRKIWYIEELRQGFKDITKANLKAEGKK